MIFVTSSAQVLCTWQWCVASASGCCMTRTPPTEIVVCERSSFQLYAFNLNAVDDMLLLRVALVGVEVVRADDVDGRGGGASLHHVHYVVGVRDVEPEIVDET